MDKRAIEMIQQKSDERLPLAQRSAIADQLGLAWQLSDDTGLNDKGLPDIGWVNIPQGAFHMGSAQDDDNPPREEIIEKDFHIARYPVTNAQYEAFIRAGGYDDKSPYWGEAGLHWLQESSRRQPQYWQDFPRNIPNCPVVGVTWYEANAFCHWLEQEQGESMRKATGYDGKILLPTEMQWERAARGVDNTHEYPWGNDWAEARCNSTAAGLESTSAVDLFPAQRREGEDELYDMVGNTWEWCSDYYDKDKDSFNIRGGAYWHDKDIARCSFRPGYLPDFDLSSIGFRCVFSLAPTEY